jgi:hypothetical protein
MSIIFSRTAKSLYLGVLLFLSTILFRQLGSSLDWLWYALIVIDFILVIILVNNINKVQENP